MNNNNNNYKALKDQWYRKLAEEGFEDIEDENGNLKNHKGSFHSTGMGCRNGNLVFKQSLEDYYRLASHKLYDAKFPSKLHKDVWTLHVAGKSREVIAKELKVSVTAVRWRIAKLRKAFGL